MNTIKTLTLGLLAVQMTTSCGFVPKQASAEKANIQVTQGVEDFTVEGFANGRLRLPKVTMFLWKQDLKGDDVKEVLYNSAVLGKVEQRRFEAESGYGPVIKDLTAKVAAAEEAKSATITAQKTSQTNLDAANKAIPEIEEFLKLKNAKRNALILERDAEMDPKKVEELNLKIAGLEAEIADLQKLKSDNEAVVVFETANISNQTTKIVTLTQQIAQITEGIKVVQGKLDAAKATLDAVEQKSSKIIFELTDYYKKAPSEFGVNFTDNGPIVFIRNWDPEDGLGPRTFTSFPKGTEVAEFEPDAAMDYDSISNVTYVSKGGKFSMVVHAGHGYSFKISFARSDFADPFKRLNFGGDIVRSRKGEADRIGVIKLTNTKKL